MGSLLWGGTLSSSFKLITYLLFTLIFYFEYTNQLLQSNCIQERQVYLLEQSQWSFFLYVVFELVIELFSVDSNFHLLFAIAALMLLILLIHSLWKYQNNLDYKIFAKILIVFLCFTPILVEFYRFIFELNHSDMSINIYKFNIFGLLIFSTSLSLFRLTRV